MNNELAMRWAWHQKLPPNTKLVLLALAYFSYESCFCVTSIERIVKHTNINEAKVKRVLVELEKKYHLIKYYYENYSWFFMFNIEDNDSYLDDNKNIMDIAKTIIDSGVVVDKTNAVSEYYDTTLDIKDWVLLLFLINKQIKKLDTYEDGSFLINYYQVKEELYIFRAANIINISERLAHLSMCGLIEFIIQKNAGKDADYFKITQKTNNVIKTARMLAEAKKLLNTVR